MSAAAVVRQPTSRALPLPRPESVSAATAGRWQVEGIEGVTSDDDTALTHLRDGALLVVRRGRLERGPGYGAAPTSTRHALARAGAILRLRERNRFFIHASGAVDDRGRAWLFTGPSGSGKSTLAYSLARHGWRVLGDDGVIVEPVDGGVVAHSWRQPLLVSADLAPHFPELREREADVLAGDARRRVPLGAAPARRAAVAALIFVERAESGALEPLGQATALVALIPQSPWVLIPDSHAAAHLGGLRRLVASVPLFRLGHGPSELHTIARALEEALP
jgi:hypothetical protein